MMDTDDGQLPLIIFDEVSDASSALSSGQNEHGPSANSVYLSEERVCLASVSLCGGRVSKESVESDSTGEASEGERIGEQAKDLDASGMEDMIQKILEKYGETDEQTGGRETSGQTTTTTSQDAAKLQGASKREVDVSVSDMIQRESSKWDRVYGTEDKETLGSTRDRTGRKEIARGPTTSTEDAFKDVEIGSVIRSQTGVAKRLISVSEGLDEVNNDLEDMKRELKRIQTKAYNCLEGGDILGGQTAVKEFAPIEEFQATVHIDRPTTRNHLSSRSSLTSSSPSDGGIYRRKNEWVEEREGVVKFDDEITPQQSDRYWNAHPDPSSYLPGIGRAHIKERDTNLAHLLTIAEPVESYRHTRSLVDGGELKRDRHLVVDRFGRPTTQLVSDEESSSRHRWHGKGSHAKPDGYCYMCEEFGEVKGVPTFDEPTKVIQKSHGRTYQSIDTYDETPKEVHRSYNQTYQSTPAYDEPTDVFQNSHNQAYRSLSITDLDQTSHRRSREDQGGIYKTPSGIYFYSDDPDEAILYPDGITRSFTHQSSVPRGFQSQSQSAAVQRPTPQTHRSSSEFTSRFLTKVRRRNSLGGRLDTDRYRVQTLTGY